MLRATTACTFSTSQLPKVVRACGAFTRFTAACTFSTSQVPKVFRSKSVLTILTSTCASRHIGVHFFDSSTSKSAPKLRCFLAFCTSKCVSCRSRVHLSTCSHNGVLHHFDSDMCFAPQPRALSDCVHCEKCSGTLEKTGISRLSYLSGIWRFFLLIPSLLTLSLLRLLPPLMLHLSILSEV